MNVFHRQKLKHFVETQIEIPHESIKGYLHHNNVDIFEFTDKHSCPNK